MADACIEKFLAEFDDNNYPADLLKNYELMECLAHNEFGETLLIRDRCTDNYCVAKCYTDPNLLPSVSESSLLRNFHHIGLPAFIGEYQNDSMLCVVRGYIKGTPLDKLVQEKPLNLKQSLDIITQLCEILTYLHSQKPPVIHRDIKPQNIIMDEHGKITLIDFGISRTYDENAHEDTIFFGTRQYAAPEQYGFAQTDPRADIFSVGVLLGWLLTGKSDIEQAKKLIPSRRLLGIVEKCTAFDPKYRYKNAAHVKSALTGRTRRRRSLAVLAALLYFHVSAGIRFREPLIEKAVRLSLGLDENAVLTEGNLLSVDEIFILGDQAAANYIAYENLVDDFANSGGSLARGSIESLDDLTKLVNISRVSLAYQNITDLSPLAQLPNLEMLDLRNNPMDDLSPLAQSASLTTLVVFDSNIDNFSALKGCPRLSVLDAGDTQLTAITMLEGLEALQTLVIRKAPLRSLEGIADHPLLEKIYLSETLVTDLSPLLDLPQLQQVEVSQDMRSAVEAMADLAHFEIVNQ